MLNIEDGSAPFSVLIHDRLEAIRLDSDYAKSLSQDIRGSVWLETLTRFARNAGLAILGPSFQDSENSFGLPIRFDYVAEHTLVDVLARHRLRHTRRQ